MTGRKIAIVGTADGWREAPFDDDSWEIWACNAFALTLKRVDCIFEIHRRWWNNDQDNEYLSKLRVSEVPVYSIVPIGGPRNIVLDREALFKKYGSTWFSSSFGYMLGLAFDQGVSEIGFWGVDMESREEYIVQQAGLRHWIDIAPLFNIKIHIPDDSMLGREIRPYPDRFETVLALTLEKKARKIRELIVKVEFDLSEARRRKYIREGEDGFRSARDEFQVERYINDLGQLKGQLWATQQYKRLFVWNTIDPDIGEDSDIEDCGPV